MSHNNFQLNQNFNSLRVEKNQFNDRMSYLVDDDYEDDDLIRDDDYEVQN
jgi:hypothetical protein